MIPRSPKWGSGNSVKRLFHQPRYGERTRHGRASLKGREARRYCYRLFIRYERQHKAVSVDAGVQGQLPSEKLFSKGARSSSDYR